MDIKKLGIMLILTTLATGCASTDTKLYQGLGKNSMFRVGPGKDSKGEQVYSINYTTAAVVFDEQGKIVDVSVDALEISTPNYDGETMPHFSGWPGTQGINVTNHNNGEVTGISDNSLENIKNEVDNWKTKRERGDNYGMSEKNDWHKQMANFNKFFIGKTVTEIENIFLRTFSDVNGRPLKVNSRNEKDKAKYETLSQEDKNMLTDLTAGATMSIKDPHGDIIDAIKDAYKNRNEFLVK
ncbi:MAG: FMN-binding protein [Fusobacteriaceae bacterium]